MLLHEPWWKVAKYYLVLDLEIVRKNRDSKYINTRRTGDVWRKKGPAIVSFLDFKPQGDLGRGAAGLAAARDYRQ